MKNAHVRMTCELSLQAWLAVLAIAAAVSIVLIAVYR